MQRLLVLMLIALSPCFASRSDIFKKLQPNQKAVSYGFTGGRLGDNLVSCTHALWLSYKYNIPFIYNPFPYSDHFILHTQELHINDASKLFIRKWVLQNERDIQDIFGPALIIVPYFPEVDIEIKVHHEAFKHHYPIDWDNPVFKKMVRDLLAPRLPIETMDVPKNLGITIAMHVRKGGNVDSSDAGFILPLKLPPDSFYIAALRKMSALCSHQEMYVYLFTDDLHPEALMLAYQNAVRDLTHIHFDCRRKDNSPFSNVLEDFYSIQKFDCLIRPQSNFTIIAEKLKDFQHVISPQDARIVGGNVYIDTLAITSQAR